MDGFDDSDYESETGDCGRPANFFHENRLLRDFVPVPPEKPRAAAQVLAEGAKKSAASHEKDDKWRRMFDESYKPPPTEYNQPVRMWMLDAENVRSIHSGGWHSFVLNEKGTPLSWGAGEAGQLCNGEKEMTCKPGRINHTNGNLLVNVKDVACGGWHSLILTDLGYVLASGQNSKGQLGSDDQKDWVVPVQIRTPFQMKIVSVACGLMHSLVITENGLVFAWGDGTLGQLGTGGRGIKRQPVRVKLPNTETIKADKVAAGDGHSAVIMSTGDLYMFGYGSEGQLGMGNASRDKMAFAPRVLDFPEPVLDVACGAGHTAIITESRRMYTFGRGDFGQLGNEKTRNVWTPFEIERRSIEAPIKAIALGYRHTCCLTDAGDLYTWGCGRQGQLGHGILDDECAPRRLNSLKRSGARIAKIAAGREHTIALTDEGVIYNWGIALAVCYSESPDFLATGWQRDPCTYKWPGERLDDFTVATT